MAPGGADARVRDLIARTTVRTKTWLERDGRFVIGDGGATLLLALLEHGSLLGAAREITWSYRHAWGYLRQAEAVLGSPLTMARSGRGPARGTLLTETGRLVLERLLAIRNSLDDALGMTGPTRAEIAARGRRRVRARADRTTPRRGLPAAPEATRPRPADLG
jgi:molybdate transport repressor ModE-like protein